ncbi:MAG: hypothetical protein KF813_13730 [Trueperaceae bacterium]|nr:hypothetical protein [Trueperaceae bacterium]
MTRFITKPMLTALAFALCTCAASFALAQDVQPTIDQLRDLRSLLARYEDVEVALADGFEQFGGCMEGPQGSQGIHFTNGARIGDPALDVMVPEVLMYEPREDGSLRLIGLELLVFQEDWHAAGNAATPVQLGREFGINMTLLDRPFYALHIWVWQHNPSGFYANWNPLVSCEFEVNLVGHGH